MEALKGLLDSLGIAPKALIAQIAIILILFWLFKKYVFARIASILGSRQAQVKDTMEKTQKELAEVEQLKQEYTTRLAEIELEARQHIQQAIKESQEIRDELIKEAREEAEKIMERARRQIGHEKDRVLLELRQEIADLAILAASKIINEKLDDRTHRKLIAEFIDKLEETQS